MIIVLLAHSKMDLLALSTRTIKPLTCDVFSLAVCLVYYISYIHSSVPRFFNADNRVLFINCSLCHPSVCVGCVIIQSLQTNVLFSVHVKPNLLL